MEAIYTYFQANYHFRPPFSTNPETLVKEMTGCRVNKAFLLAYAHKPGLSRQLNSWLYRFSLEHPRLIPFASVHPGDPDLGEIITEALDRYDFAGVKLHCLVQKHPPDHKKLFPVYEALIERSKAAVVHASTFPQAAEGCLGIAYIKNLLRHFPDLNLIIPHLGLNELAQYRGLLEKHKGLYLDTAFVFQNQGFIPPLEEIKATITGYPDRILYGSDYPFIMEPPVNGIKRILELDLPEDTMESLFKKNARQFLNRLNFNYK